MTADKALAQILADIDALQAKINARRPLPEPALRELRDYFKIGLTYTSNALEGNSLTESETKVVLEDGLTIGGKPLRDHQEALGHAEAYEQMFGLITAPLTVDQIKSLHRLFYQRIDTDNAGRYRTKEVLITGSRYPLPKPNELDELMEKFVATIPSIESAHHPAIAAALVHKQFVFIHPFIDGNGRVARLLMNVILLRSRVVIAIVPPILRAEYIQTLEQAHEPACRRGREDSAFIRFIAERVKKTQKDYLRLLG